MDAFTGIKMIKCVLFEKVVTNVTALKTQCQLMETFYNAQMLQRLLF